jgi:quercetin dioxygenase-like cupin family protein
MEKNNVIKTDYGYDVVWTDSDLYCSKILVFEKQGAKTPLHFHKSKTKTWFVNSGAFTVQWVNTKEGKSYAQELPEGATFHVEPLTPVTLKSKADNSVIAETSNSNQDDFYRLG